MGKEKQKVESPLSEDGRLKARQEAKRVLADDNIRGEIRKELDVSTAKLELARARIAQVCEANIKELEADKTLSEEDKKKAIAKQRIMIDEAEARLEEHVEWNAFVTNTFNI